MRCLRAAQMHLADHIRPAGPRVWHPCCRYFTGVCQLNWKYWISFSFFGTENKIIPRTIITFFDYDIFVIKNVFLRIIWMKVSFDPAYFMLFSYYRYLIWLIFFTINSVMHSNKVKFFKSWQKDANLQNLFSTANMSCWLYMFNWLVMAYYKKKIMIIG